MLQDSPGCAVLARVLQDSPGCAVLAQVLQDSPGYAVLAQVLQDSPGYAVARPGDGNGRPANGELRARMMVRWGRPRVPPLEEEWEWEWEWERGGERLMWRC